MHCLARVMELPFVRPPWDANPFARTTGFPLTPSSLSPIARPQSAVEVAELSTVLAVIDSCVQYETDPGYLSAVPEVSAYGAATVAIHPGVLGILRTGRSERRTRSFDNLGTARLRRTNVLYFPQIGGSGKTRS